MLRHALRSVSTHGPWLALLLGGAASAQDQPVRSPDRTLETVFPVKPASVDGEFTIVSLGDNINAHPVARDASPDLQALIDLIRAGDVAIANQEGMFFDPVTFRGSGPGSPYILRGDAAIAGDLKAIGIDMVSMANNHAGDWDVAGMQATARLLDAAGIVHAGDGDTLSAARGARFLDTPRGRIALVAAASTFKPGSQAQDALPDVPARPGISHLRLKEITVVTPATMKTLRAAFGKTGATGDLTVPAGTRSASIAETIYREGAAPGFRFEINTYDRRAILQSIRDARAKADLAVFTVHAHENTDGLDDQAMGDPADFLVQLSHEAVDAGADVVMDGGPHSMRGIEIYRGKPIFYGLAVFLFGGNVVVTQDQRTEDYGPVPRPAVDPHNPASGAFRMPASWDDGFAAATVFRNGRLAEVRLYPLDHGQSSPGGRKGTGLAPPARARSILADLQRASRRFGTRIAIDGAVGIIRP